MLKKKPIPSMYYVSEAKLINSKTDLLKQYEIKSPPEIFVSPLLTAGDGGLQTSFQGAIRLTVTIGQFFGLNPVIGVSEVDTKKISMLFKNENVTTFVCSVEFSRAYYGPLSLLNYLYKHDPFHHFLNRVRLSNRSRTFLLNNVMGNTNVNDLNNSMINAVSFTGKVHWSNVENGVVKVEKEKFEVQSWRFAYSFLSIMLQSMLVCFSFSKLFTDSNSNLSANATLVFYTTNCMTTILFLRVAMKWPGLCQYISESEVSDPSVDRTLVKKCNVSCVLVLFLAALEHLLSDLSGLAGAIDCQKEKNLFEAFSIASFPWVFQYSGYSPYLGVLAQFINLQFTFNWNFSDVFVICISFYLTSRFEQVNRRIVAVYGKHTPSSFWRTVREDYSRVTGLVRRVDDVIGAIIFISFANNLFFICLQLLHTLAEGIRRTPSCRLGEPDERPLQGYEQTVYFVYSFGFLIARSLAVSLIASHVHTASREPAHTLYCVPSTAYCVEVQRFLDQVHCDTIALSGLKFFNVRRGLVLTIAGTIVTYELVLMQFTGVTPTPPPSTITVPVFINTSKV